MGAVGGVAWRRFRLARVGLGFDVLGAFAVGVGGAAPELAVGFACGAAAHGFSTQRAEWGAGLLGAGLGAGGVEALSFEVAAVPRWG